MTSRAARGLARIDVRRLVFAAGLLILALIVAAAVFAPLIAGQDPYLQNLEQRMAPPGSSLSTP